MNTNTYKDKSETELKDQLLDLRRAQMNLRFRKKQGSLEKISEIKKTRRDVARIKTALSAIKKKG